MKEIKGFSRSRAEDTPNSVTEWGVDFVPKVKLETVATNEMTPQVVEAIQKHAYTGNVGDGKIFVYDVGQGLSKSGPQSREKRRSKNIDMTHTHHFHEHKGESPFSNGIGRSLMIGIIVRC